MYNMYEVVHSNMGLHFWDLPTLAVAIALIVVVVVHTRNQKKREDEFNGESDHQLKKVRSDSSGVTRKA